MLRKACFLMFVLLLVCGDTALARHGRCFLRQRRCVRECCSVRAEDVIRHCLRDLYMDFPSGPDVYYCLTYDNGCPDDGYEDFWYGNGHPYPQSCLHDPIDCESEPMRDHGFGGGRPPGHEDLPPADAAQHAPFSNKSAACNWLISHLASSSPSHTTGGSECKYYKFSYHGPRYAVVIDVNANNTGAGYVGVETAYFPGEPFIDLTACLPRPLPLIPMAQ